MNERMTEAAFSEITLRDAYYVLFRHKKKIITFFLAVVLIFSYYFFTIPKMYLSEASLLIKVGRESLDMIPTKDQDRAVSVSRSRMEDLNDEIEIIKSREVYEDLVDEIGIEAFLKKGDNNLKNPVLQDNLQAMREGIILNLMKNVDINIRRNTNIIGISYEAKSPELANTVVSRLIDFFLEKHIKVHYSTGSYDFFEDQVNQSQMALNKAEEELAEIKNKLNISSLEEYSTILSQRIETLQQQINENLTNVAESESKVQTLKNSLEDLPETIETGRIIGNENTLRELYALQLREQELLSKYSEENIQVKEIHRQIEEAKKLLNDESQINQGINTNYQLLQQNLFTEQSLFASLKARNIELNKSLSNAKQERNQLNTMALEISQLKRNRDIFESSYLRYSDSLEEARIDQIVQKQKLSNIRILQPATLPIRPVATRKYRNIGLGLFLGFFGSIGLAFFSEYMDHSIKTQEDVEKWLQLRTLVVIPEHPIKKCKCEEKTIS